jgi:hypothetical protein
LTREQENDTHERDNRIGYGARAQTENESGADGERAYGEEYFTE